MRLLIEAQPQVCSCRLRRRPSERCLRLTVDVEGMEGRSKADREIPEKWRKEIIGNVCGDELAVQKVSTSC